MRPCLKDNSRPSSRAASQSLRASWRTPFIRARQLGHFDGFEDDFVEAMWSIKGFKVNEWEHDRMAREFGGIGD